MNQKTHHAPSITLVLVLLLALFLRVWQLDTIPPGLTHDEAGHGQDAMAILRGARPLYETVGYGREPLYDYTVAMAMALLGQSNYVALRLTSALFGWLTIVVTYLWLRRAFGPWEALLACAWLAGSFWAVSVSRQGLRSVMLPALLGAAVYAWWRGAYSTPGPALPKSELRQIAWFALSGVLLAASLWTYMAARVTWALFVALPVFTLLTDRPRFKRRWPGMGLTLVLAAALAAPMFAWLYQHPAAEQRFSQLGQPLQLLSTGNLGPVLQNSLEALGMLTFRADDLWMYNLPGRPWLGAIEGALFYIGLAIALWRWRQPQYTLALLWLAIGLVPSLITGVSASATRTVAILPVLYLFPAIAVTQISNLKLRISNSAPNFQSLLFKSAILLAVILFIAVGGVRTYYDYFYIWARARDVRVAYHTTLFETARQLDAQAISPGSALVLSSIYPGYYHDPYAMSLLLSRRDLQLRWMDGRSALVFPSGPGASLLVVPALAPLDPALEKIIAPHTRLIESRSLQPDDLNPRFDLYEWDSPASLNAALAQPTAVLTQELDLGHTLALIGYTLSPQTVAPGDTVTVVTYWRILAPPDPELDTVLFTHLLTANDAPAIVAQQDHLGAPTWNWHTGETIAQVHHLTLGQDIAGGLYPLAVGAYIRPGPTPINPNPPTTRLMVFVDGQAVSDRILLSPVQVKR